MNAPLVCLLITYLYARQVIITVIRVVVVSDVIVVVVIRKQIAYKLHSLTAKNLHENIL